MYVCKWACVLNFKCTVHSLLSAANHVTSPLECVENPSYNQQVERRMISPVSGFLKLYPNVIS